MFCRGLALRFGNAYCDDMENVADKQLLEQIEAFLIRNGMNKTTFGKGAMNDPAFVDTVRNGRELRRKTKMRVYAFMISHERAVV